MIITRKTNKPDLVFIGTGGNEEYYLDLGDDDLRGWSFMGLRGATEDELREQARETEPSEVLGISREEFNAIERYFDYERFEDDMEDDWENHHDIQAEREEDGKTLYLGFGSGQDIFGYFEKHAITDFESYKAHFQDIGMAEPIFNPFLALIKKGQERKRGIVSSDNTTEQEKDRVEKEEIMSVLKPLIN